MMLLGGELRSSVFFTQ